jgi:iron complex outermembrane receptor protein
MSVKIPGGFSLQVNGNYESPKVIAGGTLREAYWVDVALKKNLWKNKATVIVNCSDIFKTHQYITDYNNALYNETIDRVKETRIGTLTFTYRFGKSEMGKGGRSKKDSNMQKDKEDRENNLKGDDKDDQGGGMPGGQGGGGGAKSGGNNN